MSTTGGRKVRAIAVLVAMFVAITTLFLIGPAQASIVPTVNLRTSASFSVLAGSTVTNSGPTTLARSLGVWPGTAVTGFPPGMVTPPGTKEVGSPVAMQAQSDVTTAYNDAAGRPLNATTGADLAGQTLQGGVYAATTTKGPLQLTGTVTLDGASNASSVFIFQTNSTLITGSGARVRLINGALACNVFWQVGSSATLGSGTTFVGNILALTAITLQDSVVVHGRALARNAEVTLLNDTFNGPGCVAGPTTTTSSSTTTTLPSTTTTSGATTTTTSGGTTTTISGGGGTGGTTGGGTGGATGGATGGTTGGGAAGGGAGGATGGATGGGAGGATGGATGGGAGAGGATGGATGGGSQAGSSADQMATTAGASLPQTGREVWNPFVLAVLALTEGALVFALRGYFRAIASK